VALAALRGDKIGELTMVNDFLSKALRRDH